MLFDVFFFFFDKIFFWVAWSEYKIYYIYILLCNIVIFLNLIHLKVFFIAQMMCKRPSYSVAKQIICLFFFIHSFEICFLKVIILKCHLDLIICIVNEWMAHILSNCYGLSFNILKWNKTYSTNLFLLEVIINVRKINKIYKK